MKLRTLIAPSWRRHWPMLMLGVVLMLAGAASALVLLALSGWLITASALVGLGLWAVVDIFTPGAGIRLAAVSRTVARYGERLATHRASLALLADLRIAVLDRLLKLDEIQLRRMRSGDSMDRLVRDVDQLDHLFAGVAGPVLTAFGATVGASIALALLMSAASAWLVLIAGLAATAILAAASRWCRRPIDRLSARQPQLRATAAETLDGLKSLVAEHRTHDAIERLAEHSDAVIAEQNRLSTRDAVIGGLVQAVSALALVAVFVAALPGLSPVDASGPRMVLALLVVLGLTEIWQALPAASRQLRQSRIAAARVTDLAATRPLLSQPARPRAVPADNGLACRAVRFAWPDSPVAVFERLELEIRGGQRVAVTGPSGAGKTTLGLLLMRQIDPDSGCVTLGGEDLRELDPDALRRTIGYLAQRPAVFADTLANNLRLARPAADDAALRAALEAAGLGPLLERLPEGLDSWLDESGANLSGGEQRRLGLARLMLIDPPVVILDEPTTGLDETTARALAASLDDWLGDRTAVMISHEPDLLPRHDRRLDLAAGGRTAPTAGARSEAPR
jgi:ATP-binding cassette subfamily C protein CydC